MTEIKRYKIEDDFLDLGVKGGLFVREEDYAALQEQVRALAAENVVIKSSIPNLKDIEFDNENMDDASLGEDIGFNEAVELMKKCLGQTPATDAALCEIRAQALDDMADDCEADWLDTYIDELRSSAARIRAGEQP